MRSDGERIDELETRILFQEDTIARLNDALVDQQKRIDELETLINLAIEQLQKGHDDSLETEPPPPHY